MRNEPAWVGVQQSESREKEASRNPKPHACQKIHGRGPIPETPRGLQLVLERPGKRKRKRKSGCTKKEKIHRGRSRRSLLGGSGLRRRISQLPEMVKSTK